MPTPIRWHVPTQLSGAEQRVADQLHRIGKFYAFLREIRAQLFDEAFEAELAAAYQPRGVAPLPPALLAMVTVPQAYDQVGDAEAVVTAQVDQRWQLALGCLGASAAPLPPVTQTIERASRGATAAPAALSTRFTGEGSRPCRLTVKTGHAPDEQATPP